MFDKIYHYSCYETVDGKQVFYEVSLSTQYVQTTTHTVLLMKQLTMQLIFTGCKFESQAAVYNAVRGPDGQVRLRDFTSNFRHSNTSKHPDGQDWELNVTRLEDGWFLHQLVCTFAELKIQDFEIYSRQQKGYRASLSIDNAKDTVFSTTMGSA